MMRGVGGAGEEPMNAPNGLKIPFPLKGTKTGEIADSRSGAENAQDGAWNILSH